MTKHNKIMKNVTKIKIIKKKNTIENEFKILKELQLYLMLK